MAQYTKSQLVSASNATYFTNTSGGISASAVRDLNDSWISSSALLSGSNTFIGDQIISGNLDLSGTITASLQTGYLYVGDSSGKTQAVATSSIIANTNTGSLLVTASFASTNITFTKGDATTFNLPGFATTGSNTFTGNQTLISSSINFIGSGNITLPNGFSITANAGDVTNLSATSTIQLITEPPAGPGGEGNSIKFINRVSGSFIQFDNQQGGAGNPINFIGGASQFTLTVASGSTGKLNINAAGGIDASNSTFTASLQQGYVWVGNSSNVSTLVATSSFGTSIDTGSFATTGSNTFTGVNTFNERTNLQGINVYTGSASGIYIGDRTNFAPTTAGNIPGNQHTVVGQGALGQFGNGDLNAAFGPNTLANLVSGSSNLAMGAFAGLALVNGNTNTFIGDQAGNGMKGGDNNFFLGSSAGNNFRTGSYNIMIGLNTAGNLATGSGNLFIGTQTGTLIENNVDNQLSIKYGTDISPRRLLYKSGSEAANLYLYGGLEIENTLTASLAQGYAWVGDSNNRTTLVATSSFGTSIDTGSFATTGSNTFNGDQTVNGKLTISSSNNSYLQFTSPNNQTGSGQIFFGSLGPYIQTFSGGSSQDGMGLQLVGGLSGSFAMATRYGGPNATIELDAMDDQTNPATTRGRIQVRTNGQIDLTGYGGAITLSGSQTFIQGLRYPGTDGTNGQVITTNGSGVLTFTTITGSGGDTGSLMRTGSVSGNVLTFTKGDATTFTLTVDTGSGGGGTTYINPTLNPYSGSLILVANTFTSSSFAHISASANGQVNLVFKNNNNTADTIISGSGNMFTNPIAPTAGFKRFATSGNISLTGNLPQMSGSMAFPITLSNNYFGSVTGTTFLGMRGPVSSSAWNISNNIVQLGVNIGSSAALHAEKLVSGLTLNSNNLLGTLNLIANQSALSSSVTINGNIIAGGTTLNLSSSAVAMANNIINDSAFIFTNQYYSSSLGLGNVSLNRNNIGGQSNSIIISGSLPVGGAQNNSISDNFIFGGSNQIYIDVANARLSGTAVYKNVVRTGLMGNNLIVSGSSLLADGSSYGSVFVGRYNADDNRRNKTSDVVFAVGTGNSTTRKTGFLIDSGSNSYFEGTLNVSGSTAMNGNQDITGSLLVSSFTTLASVSSSLNFADDTAAAAGGVPLGGLYRNGNFVMIRLT